MALIDLASRSYFAGKDIMANFNKLLSTSTDVQNVKFGTLETTGNATLGGDVSIPSGDLYTVALTDYGGESTIVGWSSRTTETINYHKVGNLVFVSAEISGTSNSAAVTFTLPFSAKNTVVGFAGALGYAVDNGTAKTVACRMNLPVGSSTVSCYTDMASGSWTASGTKTIRATLWYEAA